MTFSRKFSTLLNRWFSIGLVSILALSIALRFWGLSRFNTLVFDEVYFAKFGYNYLTQTPFFDSHPPLGKYFIAFGIWLQGFNPFGYRWMNALTGSLIPLVIAGIAYQLSHRRSYALVAGLFAAADGLLLVESRYALINVYLLIFGLLGQWFFLLALDAQGKQRWLWLTLSGISLGGTIAVKWNGLGFLLGIYLAWLCAWCVWIIQQFFWPTRHYPSSDTLTRTLFQKLRQLNPAQLLYLPAIAAGVYCLVWIPHRQLNPTPSFWELQKQMLTYHGRIGSGPNVHPYCSSWYTWPWMKRPVDYFYQTALNSSEPVPTVSPPLPSGAAKVIYDVHAIGNPALWWLSTAAIAILLWMLADQLWTWVMTRSTVSRPGQPYLKRAANLEIPVYLLLSYAANFLPWASVSRCTFLYHYMPAFVFSLLAIAWLVDRWLQSNQQSLRALGLTAIFLILASLVFWLPIYLGLPLSPEGFRLRMWFPSWI